MKWLTITLCILTIAVFIFAIILALKKPHSLDNTLNNKQPLHWQTQYKILPIISKINNEDDLYNDVLLIKNIRNFRYDNNQNIIDQQYFDQSFNVSELRKLWYGISHFGKNGLAHVFLSFEFSHQENHQETHQETHQDIPNRNKSNQQKSIDKATTPKKSSQYLAVSIEARLRQQDTSYHPIKGLLRAYTKTIILATEQDIIGLRSHIRQEPVYLYDLQLEDTTKKNIFLNIINAAQQLETTPEFYNTLTDNCMTGLLDETNYSRVSRWFDYRILLPGYSDKLAYSLELLGKQDSFSNIRQKALINSQNTTIDDDAFSIKIRQ